MSTIIYLNKIKMTEAIWVALIGGVIGPIVVLSLKWWFDNKFKKKKSDMVTEALEVGALVSSKLDSIKEEYDADRVWLVNFITGVIFIQQVRV